MTISSPKFQHPRAFKTLRLSHRSIGLLLCLLATIIWNTASTEAGTTTLLSVDNAEVQGNDISYPRALSRDGRFICFESQATNLVQGDTNGQNDIFIRDRQKGKTTRINVSSTGEQADSSSANCRLSADGRFLVFSSRAANLVPGDTNNSSDVFVRDRKTGTTTRVSVSSTGEQGNGDTANQSISGDGRFVAFVSMSSNLVPGDTNGTGDLFLHVRTTGITRRVSVNSSGEQAAGCFPGSCSQDPAISDNGRFIAFRSDATNLVPGDTNGKTDIFVHDVELGTTTRVTVNSLGFEGNGNSFLTSLSADGRIVAFGSEASNLVDGDTNGVEDAFVYDFDTGALTRVSVSSTGTQANAGSFNYALSSDGRFVSFNSAATNLVPGDTNGLADVFVHDLNTRETIRVSVDSFGNEGNGYSGATALNGNGRFIAFSSRASNLVAGDTNGVEDSFIHDRQSRKHTKD